MDQRRMRPWPKWLAAAIGAVGVIAIGFGIAVAVLELREPDQPSTITAKGMIQIHGYPNAAHDNEGNCWGYGGFKDIKSGAQVVITDEAGKSVALGYLGAGRQRTDAPTICELPWSIADVPAGQIYGVEVVHRGRLQYSRDQLSTGITMTVGG